MSEKTFCLTKETSTEYTEDMIPDGHEQCEDCGKVFPLDEDGTCYSRYAGAGIVVPLCKECFETTDIPDDEEDEDEEEDDE